MHNELLLNYLCYVLCNSKSILVTNGKVKQNLGITEAASARTQPDPSSRAVITLSSMLQCQCVVMNATDVTLNQLVPLHRNCIGSSMCSLTATTRKVKVMSICIAPIHETFLRRSGTARIVKGYHSFTCTPCVTYASGISHTCLCLSSRSWYIPRRDRRLSRPWCKEATATSQWHSTTQPLSHLYGLPPGKWCYESTVSRERHYTESRGMCSDAS